MMEAFDKNQERIVDDLIPRVRSDLRLLDSKVASEYLEAVQFAPFLVEAESRVIDFLRTEDYHTLRAANRMALYWKRRKEFFGEDRWLLPLRMTGAGSLTPDQIELLRTGYHTQTSSAVFLSNHSRIPNDITRVHPAILFYIVSVTTSEQLQTEGMILFHIISTGNTRSYLTFPPDVVQKLRDCLPIRVKNIVVGQIFEPGREHLLEYLAYAKQLQSGFNLRRPSECVTGDSITSTLNALEKRGIDRSIVPVEMGGDYFYARDFDAWVRHRLTIEGAMDAAPPIRNTETAHAAARQTNVEAKPAAKPSSQKHRSSPAAQRKKEGPNPASVVASSSDVTNAVPKAAAAAPAATADSTSVASEDDRSSTTSGELLVQRRPGESDEAFEKRRTQVYGKRFHAKRKQEISAMKQECQMLKQANQALASDNEKLELLLIRARDIVDTAQHEG